MVILNIAVYTILAVLGMVLVKLGSKNPLELTTSGKVLSFSLGYVTLAGYACYILSFFTYMTLIVQVDLSYLLPIGTGCVYILIMAASIFIFKEKITFAGMIGNALVLIGVLVVGFNKK